jgi:hypothetical protein
LIDKALDKQHRKGFVGVRLHQENMRIMQLSRRLGKHQPPHHSHNLTHVAPAQEGSPVRGVQPSSHGGGGSIGTRTTSSFPKSTT